MCLSEMTRFSVATPTVSICHLLPHVRSGDLVLARVNKTALVSFNQGLANRLTVASALNKAGVRHWRDGRSLVPHVV